METVAREKLTPERRREMTRAALIDAAEEVFARRGFNGASLDEIAETAGFTRGAIYKHFESKEDLFFAVNDKVNARAIEVFGEFLDRTGGVVIDDDHIDGLIATWRSATVNDPDEMAFALEVFLYALRNPEMKARLLEQRRKNLALVVKFMQTRGAEVAEQLALPAELIADMFLTTSDAFAQAAVIDPDKVEVYKKFMELFIPAAILDPGRPVQPK